LLKQEDLDGISIFCGIGRTAKGFAAAMSAVMLLTG